MLNNVNSPADIKSLNLDELNRLCSELREYIIECCSTNPGHLGSSLGAVELAVALHKVFDTPVDKIVWDVGHQAYAHKILTGRREEFRKIRTIDGPSGFPKMSESPYDSFGTGHSSTSISATLGMAIADEKLGIKANHIAVIGDGAMTGGLAFEGLNNAGAMKSNILVILNDNQISIDTNTGAMHNYLIKFTTSRRYNSIKKNVWQKLGESKIRDAVQSITKGTKRLFLKNNDNFSLFDSMGFRYFGPVNGNDMAQLIPLLERMKNVDGPKLLHIMTVKGKGYAPAEAAPTIWHAPGKFNPESGERVKDSSKISKYQEVFGTTITELALKNSRIVGITPAMLSGSSLNIMQKALPDRVFDVGIAEEHAVTFSAGLAAEGIIPVCNIYSSFMQRAYDNVIHDVALQKLKVVFCLDRGGIVGEDGATHHGVFDMAAFRPIPNLAIVSPYNELELRNMLYSAINLDSYPATIIRYPRGRGEGVDWKEQEFTEIEYGKGRLISGDPNQSNDAAVLSIGPVGNVCARAVAKAVESGAKVAHYDMRFIKPIDIEILEQVCKSTRHIITVEDGAIAGGLHGAVAEYIADNGLGCRLTGLGIGDEFVPHGTPSELYHLCRIDEESILKAIVL